ncbi:Uu.00g121420.m01.CDS01 [Anthostomella pinea]|uniref:Uu.00g121420.m01.CDS01 n=1 Tax=Anthostomella pinea TaxID=933095 RepID=A0AAI8VGX6_9PEZI|nr:Uu.00g121420.m01.CDS01 [Anthostomella pinea]
MPLNARTLLRAARLPSVIPRQPQIHRAFLSTGGKLPGGTPGEASEQAVPLGPYYESILIKPTPLPDPKPEEPPTSSPKSPRTTVKKTPAAKKPKDTADDGAKAASSSAETSSPEPSTTPASAQEKARIIFGSRLAGPAERAERLDAIRNRSTIVAGVLVPPRPEEPDNCCMSGCVNCVWDRYRDDMEGFVAASTKAERAMQAQRSQGPVGVLGSVSAVKGMPGPGAASMDEDGGGSETNWQADMKRADRPKIVKDLWDDDLYKNVPVGIREFMKQEKRLKEKHARDGTFGA